ncbi:unnamed protein product [Spodoptera littoralis]|uniref:Uncharacterized protein n=1 Tax=Spodoptera littoralis TaxID=7109 RepID=A0A9P0IB93_SPOLI|nr:unnamed protein product [Spodoptera littoralis]CAH1642119.1 unnamed protein product [Spodoptera littoralis]
MVHPGKTRSTHHTVRFTGDEMPKYKPIVSDSTDSPNYVSSQSYPGQDSGAPSPEAFSFQPAAQRYRHNEQRIKLLTSINQIVQQRADLEANRVTLSNLLDELRRKLKRRIDECHLEKKERMKALKQANQRLEKEKFSIVSEIEHLKRHLEKEEAHHLQHARSAVAQADNKLAAARLMRDIAELRQRVAQVEARLANELKRKRQAELDIIRLRKELSSTKSFVASLRMPPPPLRKQCSKFA